MEPGGCSLEKMGLTADLYIKGSGNLGKIVSLESLNGEWIAEIEESIHEKIFFIPQSCDSDVLEVMQDTDVLLCRDRDLSEAFLSMFPKLGMIFVVSAGVENLPFQYLKGRKILAANSSGISDSIISDYVMGAMLLFSCKFLDCFYFKQEKIWKPYLHIDGLKGKKLLIVGAGNIGKAVAAKAGAFGLKITGVKTEIAKEPFFDNIITLDKIEMPLKEADYVVCSLPLTTNTYHLFDARLLDNLKKDAVFINISRGGLVDEAYLTSLLAQKRIRGAVLDVFEQEPLGKGSMLWDLKNAVITPHSAGRCERFLKYALAVFARNVSAYRNKQALPDMVDLDKGY